MEACVCNETVSVSLENLLFSLGIVTFSRLSYRYVVGTSLKTVIKIVDITSAILSFFHTTFLTCSHKSHWITYSSVERGRCLQSSEHLRDIILCTTLAIAVCNKTWTKKRSPRSSYLFLYFRSRFNCVSLRRPLYSNTYIWFTVFVSPSFSFSPCSSFHFTSSFFPCIAVASSL